MSPDEPQEEQQALASEEAGGEPIEGEPVETEPVKGELVPEGEFFPEALIALERDRIDSFNRRTEVARRAVDANEAADQRQFSFHMEKLSRDSDDRDDRRVTGFRMLWVFIGVVVLAGGFMLAMAFFGDENQKQVAIDLVRTIANGVAGFGVIWAIINAFKRLIGTNK